MSDEAQKAEQQTYYGKDCPQGMVQVEFVSSDGERYSDYGWKPGKRATLDVYIDGQRFYIEVGDFHDGRAQRRGLHIMGPVHLTCEQTAVNACSVFLSPAGQTKGTP